jgi:hypothetical protein
MKLSRFTVSFAGPWGQHALTLEAAIDKAAELGYRAVELMGKRPHLSPLDYSLSDCARRHEQLPGGNLGRYATRLVEYIKPFASQERNQMVLCSETWTLWRGYNTSTFLVRFFPPGLVLIIERTWEPGKRGK